MRAEVVTHETITVVVRSRYRRTAIIEAQYMQAMRSLHPEIAEYERDLYAISMPRFISGSNLTPEEQAINDEKMTVYTQAIAPVAMINQMGAEYHKAANAVVPLLARVTSAIGAQFVIGADGRFDNANVAKAVEAWIDEEDPDTENTLWTKIAAAVRNVDAPLTTVEEKPPHTLTAAERADPLLVPAA